MFVFCTASLTRLIFLKFFCVQLVWPDKHCKIMLPMPLRNHIRTFCSVLLGSAIIIYSSFRSLWYNNLFNVPVLIAKRRMAGKFLRFLFRKTRMRGLRCVWTADFFVCSYLATDCELPIQEIVQEPTWRPTEVRQSIPEKYAAKFTNFVACCE